MLLWCPGLLLAVGKLHEGGTYLDVIVAGGTQCEMTQCDHSVAMGAGELTLSLYSKVGYSDCIVNVIVAVFYILAILWISSTIKITINY